MNQLLRILGLIVLAMLLIGILISPSIGIGDKAKITKNRLRGIALIVMPNAKERDGQYPDRIGEELLEDMWCKTGQEVYYPKRFETGPWFLAVPHPTEANQYLAVDADGNVKALSSQSVSHSQSK